jgi:hypothetical protein
MTSKFEKESAGSALPEIADMSMHPFGLPTDFEMMVEKEIAGSREGQLYASQLFLLGDIDCRSLRSDDPEQAKVQERVYSARTEFMGLFGIVADPLGVRTSNVLSRIRIVAETGRTNVRPIVRKIGFSAGLPSFKDALEKHDLRFERLRQAGITITEQDQNELDEFPYSNLSEQPEIELWKSHLSEREFEDNKDFFLFGQVFGSQIEIIELLETNHISLNKVIKYLGKNTQRSLSLTTITTAIAVFRDYGLDVSRLVNASPELCFYGEDNIRAKMSLLENHGFNPQDLLHRAPRLITSSQATIERGLHYCLGYAGSITGVSKDEVVRLLTSEPMILVLPPRRIRFIARLFENFGELTLSGVKLSRISIPNALEVFSQAETRVDIYPATGSLSTVASRVATYGFDFASGVDTFETNVEHYKTSTNASRRRLARAALAGVPSRKTA